MPVNVYEGEILSIPGTINDLYLPQVLSYSNNGFAPLEIQNNTDRTISITIREPIPVNIFESNLCEIYTFENLSREIEQCQKNNPKINIEHLIRTEHMNSEEKLEITKLCKEYSDIFFKPGDKLTFT